MKFLGNSFQVSLFSMNGTDNGDVMLSRGKMFLTGNFLLALDKRHIMLDYYHVRTEMRLSVEEMRR